MLAPHFTIRPGHLPLTWNRRFNTNFKSTRCTAFSPSRRLVTTLGIRMLVLRCSCVRRTFLFPFKVVFPHLTCTLATKVPGGLIFQSVMLEKSFGTLPCPLLRKGTVAKHIHEENVLEQEGLDARIHDSPSAPTVSSSLAATAVQCRRPCSARRVNKVMLYSIRHRVRSSGGHVQRKILSRVSGVSSDHVRHRHHRHMTLIDWK